MMNTGGYANEASSIRRRYRKENNSRTGAVAKDIIVINAARKRNPGSTPPLRANSWIQSLVEIANNGC